MRTTATADNHVGSGRFDLLETTIPAIQTAITNHIITAEQLTQMYLQRIAAYDGQATAAHLNAFMHVNERALHDAREADQGRAPGSQKGALFGIPVILKDNIDTKKLPTTAGSAALDGSFPQSDSFVARRILDAGAILLGKATMTEFANFLTNGMPAGYSSEGGYGYNPYDPRPDPRAILDGFGRPVNDGRPALTPGGSSSGPGIAVAANLAAIGVGTETSGSILSPGTANMLVGIKPTVGLISRDGIVPIAADQDTAGPLARTVTDAAILLGVMAGFDPHDPATSACLTPGNCLSDYTPFLDPNALQGARIAVPPFPSNRAAIMNNAIAVLTAQGAFVQIVPALAPQLPGCPSRPPAANYPPAPGCSTVLNYAFKRDLNAYLEDHVRQAFPIHSLEDVVAFNAAHAPAATKYDQDLAIFSQFFDTSAGSADTLRYQSDRAQDIALSRAAIAAVLNGPDGVEGTADDFDALLFSGNSGAATPAKAGYPSIVVPGGFFNNVVSPPFPAGFNALPGPAGVTFSGRAFSEPRLIGLAYAFEQATHYRVPPPSAPALPTDTVIRP
ncbi:MAG: amidase [Acidobacteriia bacterium]|nr:amidase [Terriglobia bacterium]